MHDAHVRLNRWLARLGARLRTRSDRWLWSRICALALAVIITSTGAVLYAATADAAPAASEGNCVMILPAGPVAARVVWTPYKRGTWRGTAIIAAQTASPIRVLMNRIQVTTRSGSSYEARLRGGYVAPGALLTTRVRGGVKVGSVLRIRVQDTSGAVGSCTTS